MSHFKVLERTFIGATLYEPGAVVEIKNTDPNKGGMRPGRTLAECSEDGGVKASKPARQAPKGPDTITQTEQGPDANDLG